MAKVSTAILGDDVAVLVCVSAYLLVCIVLSLLSPVFFFSVCHTHTQGKTSLQRSLSQERRENLAIVKNSH